MGMEMVAVLVVAKVIETAIEKEGKGKGGTIKRVDVPAMGINVIRALR